MTQQDCAPVATIAPGLCQRLEQALARHTSSMTLAMLHGCHLPAVGAAAPLVPVCCRTRHSGANAAAKRLPLRPSLQACFCSPRPILADPNIVRAWDGLTTFQATVQLLCVQIVAGYGLCPQLAQLLQTQCSLAPQLSQAAAAVLSQTALLACVFALIERVKQRNGEFPGFSHFTASRATAAVSIAVATAALASSLSLKALEASPEQARTALEMSQVLSSGDWLATVGTGAATVILAPVLEERIYRGFVLPALVHPFNINIAVRYTHLRPHFLQDRDRLRVEPCVQALQSRGG